MIVVERSPQQLQLKNAWLGSLFLPHIQWKFAITAVRWMNVTEKHLSKVKILQTYKHPAVVANFSIILLCFVYLQWTDATWEPNHTSYQEILRAACRLETIRLGLWQYTLKRRGNNKIKPLSSVLETNCRMKKYSQ